VGKPVLAALLALAVLCLAAVGWRRAEPPPATLPAPAPETRQEWRRSVEAETDGAAKDRVYRAAAAKGGPEAAAFLGERAASSEPTAALAAAALGGVRNPAALPVLRDLTASTSILAASNALRAIGALGRPEDLDLLRALTARTERSRIWHEAVRAVGRLRHPGVRSVLEPLLDSAQEAQERMSVLDGLAALASPEAAPAIERFLARPDLGAVERAFAENALKACSRNP
jgi:hypothetical protein